MLALAALGILAPLAWGQRGETDLIMERHAQAVAALESFDVRWIKDSVIGPDAPEGVLDGYEQFHMIYAGGKTYRDKIFFTPQGIERERSKEIWTGEYQLILRPPASPHGTPELQVMQKRAYEPLLGPDQIFKGLIGINPLVPFTAMRDVLSVQPDSGEFVWDEPAVFLEGSFNINLEAGVGSRVEEGDSFRVKLWLSQTHYLPLRYELILGAEGELRDIVSDIRYERIGEIYFPVEAVRTTSMPGVGHIYRADVESLRVNQPVPDDAFEFKLEPGTFVWDYILDIQYIHRSPRSLDLSVDRMLSDAREIAQGVRSPPAPDDALEIAQGVGSPPAPDDAAQAEAPLLSRRRGTLALIVGALLIAAASTATFFVRSSKAKQGSAS